MIPDMVRRQRAAEKTRRKYAGKPLDWAAYDCIRMLRSHLVAMGHKRLPALPRYTTEKGALRAFKEAGFTDLTELVESLGLERIAPAEMRLGDVAVIRGDENFDAIGIFVGRKVMGWGWVGDELRFVFATISEYKAAFRA